MPDIPERPIVLWAVPRSVSTAFERVFIERDDFTVIHEPFSGTYYHSPQRRSDSFFDGAPRPDLCADHVLADVLRPRDRRVFVKDMAYHTAGFMDRELVAHFTNSVLIRDPEKALASLHARHPDFTFEEAGYGQLWRLYEMAAASGAHVPVIQAEDLLADPEGTIRAYCRALDIDFAPDALSWEARPVPQFSSWTSWHDTAQRTSSIGHDHSRDRELPAQLRAVYRRCLPYYEQLRAKALSPIDAAMR
ncbi:MAG: hypothetical protein KY460_12820 [Actinobacteria bacterium]|nr:hypothetical protein [Actinomycetota bacterium]